MKTSLPKRLQDWDGCPHVIACGHCKGHGFLTGLLGREECPACEKRGVRWAGTISPEMEAAGYGVQEGRCWHYPKTADGFGFPISEAATLANLWVLAEKRVLTPVTPAPLWLLDRRSSEDQAAGVAQVGGIQL